MIIVHCAIPGYEGTYSIETPQLTEFLQVSNMPDTVLRAQPWTIVTPDEYITFQHANCDTPLMSHALYDESSDTSTIFSHPECTICWLSDIPINALAQKRRTRWDNEFHSHQHIINMGPIHGGGGQTSPMLNMENYRTNGNRIYRTTHEGRNINDLMRYIEEAINNRNRE